MRIQYLQHIMFEGPGKIEDWAHARDYDIKGTRLFLDEPLPAVEDFDLLVVMGGPMGANDDAAYRWMPGEKWLIRSAIEKKRKVLGICLGAQLIANVLGARVYPHTDREIGWFPIELDVTNVRNHPLQVLSQRCSVLHWHGDTFDLPVGATHLAQSQGCLNQAFAYGSHVVGLQFHLELAIGQIEALIRNCPEDLKPGPYVMEPREILAQAPVNEVPLQAALFNFLDQFVAKS